MKHGSLFSGIGGFDLASEWMGWENMFHCEWNEFGQKILNYYWAKAITYGDITTTDFTIWRGKIDILTGGFPCQPYSAAGKRLGKEDDRHLWPEMLRAIREIQPSYVVGENVRGLTNWNGGLVFDEVQSDLENEGYEVLPFLLPACAKNAPHRRDRIWFIAYSNYSRADIGLRDKRNRKEKDEGRKEQSQFEFRSVGRTTPDTNSERLQRQSTDRELEGRQRSGKRNAHQDRTNWQNFPTESPICSGNDGLSDRLDGITFPKWRNESIKGYGNAIVPQVAYEIFKSIENVNKLL
jgi:DNA (cytosine-5)-methyltransferase 1